MSGSDPDSASGRTFGLLPDETRPVEARSDTTSRLVRDPFDASWRERVLVLGGVGACVCLAIVLGLVYARKPTLELLGLIPASVFAAGKFLPLWGITGQSHFSPWELGLLIGIMDTVTVLVLVYGLEALYRVRRVKAGLTRVQANAGLVLTVYPRIRRAAVIGVVLFVLFPIAGTGAVSGTFLGILLGLKRGVLIGAVSAGGFLGGLLMAFGAIYFGEAVQNLRAMQGVPVVQWTLMIGLGVGLVVGILWLNRAYKRALTAARASAEVRPERS